MSRDLKDRTSAPAPASTKPEIAAFLDRVKSLGPSTSAGGRGRLIFALDATMSRQPTWDVACGLQAEMFREAGAVGGLDVQLVYFRGLGECGASPWVTQSEKLAALMTKI
ncbi:MAG: VWA domain-containing protein, partial [Pseudolabrys sp.]|nr:VWA domain-containing protein [Pseudolabrys sp.]